MQTENNNIMNTTKLIFIAFAIALTSCGTSKNTQPQIVEVVDASCGICQFGMTGDECELAVKINDKYYYVEGTAIDQHGDAHAEDGFCSVVRKAKVTGQIKNGVFVATSFELID